MATSQTHTHAHARTLARSTLTHAAHAHAHTHTNTHTHTHVCIVCIFIHARTRAGICGDVFVEELYVKSRTLWNSLSRASRLGRVLCQLLSCLEQWHLHYVSHCSRVRQVRVIVDSLSRHHSSPILSTMSSAQMGLPCSLVCEPVLTKSIRKQSQLFL